MTNAAPREIDQKIVNGCPHKWAPIWWRPENWLPRRVAATFYDHKTGMPVDPPDEKKFFDAGYKRGHRCTLNCGLAYLAKDGTVVPAEAQA